MMQALMLGFSGLRHCTSGSMLLGVYYPVKQVLLYLMGTYKSQILSAVPSEPDPSWGKHE